MAALTVGASAPDFTLNALHGSSFSLQDALAKGPVIAAFFKVSCPVCQFAFPYLERIYKTQDASRATIVGISQNDAKDTEKFMTQFGVTFPVLLEDPKSYAASNAYGLTNVPTIFWIADDGTIEVSSVGWVKKEIEEIHRRVRDVYSQPPSPLFLPDEKIAEFRAG
jgi:peroxiredoxin